MSDVVVTVPKDLWRSWIAEGTLPGEGWDGREEFHFYLGGERPAIDPGERVYIVAHGMLRGYAPLVRIDQIDYRQIGLVRHGGAEAVTIDEPIRGFRGYRYRWWERDEEHPFPNWRMAGIIK